MILPILHLKNKADERILRAKSVDVQPSEFGGRTLRELTENMIETMFAAKPNGVGLAAPQVGVNLNIFVMRTMNGLLNDTQETRVLINPHTAIEIGDPILQEEGCLSIPGIYADVVRFKEVGCIYWDAEGKRHGEAFTDFEARIYQHEFDHLTGTMFIDRVDWSRPRTKRRAS